MPLFDEFAEKTLLLPSMTISSFQSELKVNLEYQFLGLKLCDSFSTGFRGALKTRPGDGRADEELVGPSSTTLW